jgi:hypothetical protein
MEPGADHATGLGDGAGQFVCVGTIVAQHTHPWIRLTAHSGKELADAFLVAFFLAEGGQYDLLALGQQLLEQSSHVGHISAVMLVQIMALIPPCTVDHRYENLIRFYCKRGKMENFIKECKSGFDMGYVSSSSQIVNANRVQIHALAYNLFNWFRRLTLPETMKAERVDTLRLQLLKIAGRIVHSARYVFFKLCSHCPFEREFYETLSNIHRFQPLLE